MSGETPTYTTYKEFCGNLEQPWVTRISEAVDWTQQQTTRDQVRIEAVLDTIPVRPTVCQPGLPHRWPDSAPE